MNRSIALWGATGQAKVLWELFEHAQDRVIALFENNRAITRLSPRKQAPIYYGRDGFLEWKSLARPDRNPIYGLAAIGGSGKDRVELQEFMRANGLLPVTAVHPTAFVARDAEIGESCQILAHAAICAEAVLGASCIVNSSATVEHECNLGVGVHIGPGAKLAGLVEIDEFTFVGAGAVVLPRVRIGRNVIVGAGAVVTKDIADNLTVVGNPARPLSHGESQ